MRIKTATIAAACALLLTACSTTVPDAPPGPARESAASEAPTYTESEDGSRSLDASVGGRARIHLESQLNTDVTAFISVSCSDTVVSSVRTTVSPASPEELTVPYTGDGCETVVMSIPEGGASWTIDNAGGWDGKVSQVQSASGEVEANVKNALAVVEVQSDAGTDVVVTGPQGEQIAQGRAEAGVRALSFDNLDVNGKVTVTASSGSVGRVSITGEER